MDPKVTFVIVCLCVLTITSTEAGIPKCCIKTRHINRYMLTKVERSYVQLGNGACDIPALILYLRGKNKPICASPKLKGVLENIQGRMKQNKLYV